MSVLKYKFYFIENSQLDTVWAWAASLNFLCVAFYRESHQLQSVQRRRINLHSTITQLMKLTFVRKTAGAKMRAHPVTNPTTNMPSNTLRWISNGHPLDWHGVNISRCWSWRCKVQPRGRNKGNKRFTFQRWAWGEGRGETVGEKKEKETNSHLSISHSSVSGLRAKSVGLSLLGAGYKSWGTINVKLIIYRRRWVIN